MHEPPAAMEWATAGGALPEEVRDKSAKAPRRGVVAALIVSSKAWRCSGRAYKIREASLSAKEGSGSGCVLPRRPPASSAAPFLSSRKPGVLGSRILRRTEKYASGPSQAVPRDGCLVARPSPRSCYSVSCIIRARGGRHGDYSRHAGGAG
jgi:hypothetical protein